MIHWKHFSVTAAILILGGTVSTWAVAGSTATARGLDDAGITAAVKSEIAEHRDLQGPSQIYVETRNHVVFLSGQVYDSLSGDDATEIARKVDGVTQVVNTISVYQ